MTQLELFRTLRQMQAATEKELYRWKNRTIPPTPLSETVLADIRAERDALAAVIDMLIDKPTEATP